MANFNGPDDRENIEAQDDPQFIARLRQDIQAAIATPEAGEFRSRRNAIMAQLQAEKANATAETPGTAPDSIKSPIDFTSQREKRQTRRGLPVWVGAIAASLVIIFVSAIILNFSSNSNLKPVASEVASGVVASSPAQKAPAPTGPANAAPGAGAADSNSTAQFALATTSAATTAAATTAAAPPAGAAPMPSVASANTGAGGASAAGTVAEATGRSSGTSAATTSAATTAAATTAAARSTVAPAATPKPVTVAATSAAAAETTIASLSAPLTTTVGGVGGATSSMAQDVHFGPFQLYPQATPVTVVTDTAGVVDFLRGQAAIFLPNNAEKQRVGLSEQVIPTYKFQVAKLNAEKTENITLFYNNQAAINDYKLEAEVVLQNDNNLQVRWLYFSKNDTKLAVLVIEVANSTSMNITDFAGVKRGETGIFLVQP